MMHLWAPLCHTLCPCICVISQSVSAIYHLRLRTLMIKPGRLCCCRLSYGRLLLFCLAVRSLWLFITNRATALYECPQAQHHTVFWYSAACVLVCHYSRPVLDNKGRERISGATVIYSQIVPRITNNRQRMAPHTHTRKFHPVSCIVAVYAIYRSHDCCFVENKNPKVVSEDQ